MRKVRAQPAVTAPLVDEPARRRLLPRLSTLVIALLGLVAVATLVARGVWLGQEESRLNELIAAARSRGEPVTLADFASATTLPAEQNAATLYLRAGDEWVPSTRRRDTTDPIGIWKLEPKALDVVRADLADNAAALRFMREARARTAAQWDANALADWRAPRGRRTIDLMRPLPGITELAAREAHMRGDDREAVERIRDLYAFARALRQMPSIPSLVTQHFADGAASDLLACAAREIKFDRAIGKELIAELLAPVDAQDAVRAMQAERATIVARMEYWMAKGEPVAWLRPMHQFARPYHVRRAARHYEYLTLAAQALGEKSFADANALVSAWGTEPPGKWDRDIRGEPADVIADRALGGGHARLVEQDRQLLAVRRLMAVTVAIALYRSDNGGKFPGKLEELTPKYLPAVPRDPFSADAGPLLYRTTPEACVWSVGKDGEDDATNPLMPPQWREDVGWGGRDIEVYLGGEPPPATAPAAPADEAIDGLPGT